MMLSSKLGGTSEVEGGVVVAEMVCDDFLEKFPNALKKGNWAICFSSSIVRFVGFGNNDDFGLGPGMMSKSEHMIQNRSEAGFISGEAPLKEFVVDAEGPGAELLAVEDRAVAISVGVTL